MSALEASGSSNSPQSRWTVYDTKMQQMEMDVQGIRDEIHQMEAINEELALKIMRNEKSGGYLPNSSNTDASTSSTPNSEETQSGNNIITPELEKANLSSKTLPRVRSYSPLYDLVPFGKIEPKIKFRNPYIIAVISTMGALLFGTASSNMTPFIGNLGYNNIYGDIPGIQQGGVSAAYPGGAFVGSIISSMYSDALGRKNMICLGGISWMIGVVIQVCSAAIPHSETGARTALSIGRIIMGVSVGFASSNVPMYLQELSPPNIRGRLAVMFQLSNTLGILVMYEIAWGCSHITANGARAGVELAWGLMMIPGAIWLTGSLFLTESPRWLANMGDWSKCVEVLTFLRKNDAQSQEVRTELEEYRKAIKEETEKQTSFSDLFKGHSFRRTIASLSIQANSQLVGTNIVMYYAGPIVRMSGFSDIDVFRFTTIWFAVNFGMTLPTTFWVDRWSRRWVFIGGALGMCTCMCIIAGLTGKYGQILGKEGLCTGEGDDYTCDPTIRQQITKKSAGKATLAFSIIYLAVFAITWGGVGWVYLSEIFPPSQRGIGNGLGSATNWLFNFIITVSCPAGFINIQWKTYVIYAVFGMLAAIFTFFFVPETHGYSLDEMDKIVTKGVQPYRTDPVYLWFKKVKS